MNEKRLRKKKKIVYIYIYVSLSKNKNNIHGSKVSNACSERTKAPLKRAFQPLFPFTCILVLYTQLIEFF